MNTDLISLDGTPASALAFGTMQFGGRANAAQSAAMYDACRTAGITHFDTAWVYTDGASEEILGQLIRDERDSLLIATKVAYIGGAGPENIRRQLDQSRTRLAQDMVDILYLHRYDTETDLRDTLACLAELRAAGQFRYLGLSNFAAWQVMKVIQIGQEFDLRPAILQPMYSLIKRQAEVEILPMCADQDIAVAPYSPLGGGMLTGKYAADPTDGGSRGRLDEDPRYRERYGQRWMLDSASALSGLAAELGVAPASLAVAWASGYGQQVTPIISARTLAQLRPSLAALDIEMTPALYDRISALSPRPAPATDRLEEQA
ncbi:aldo/keto reductase [Phaeobacter inhibens]|uniref:aldo/keto reductase n=1 Tax=Phaeobacter inhibens TaxID=221822 RepID=UPI000C9A0210|nr:aldo/keto reductase [Phaeobacter inhibens]AUQ71586.1 putative oxidoreductase [Phaeobacter inhibens]UWR83696.1 aldo/keto reductase [Phaeobacter inhibens]